MNLITHHYDYVIGVSAQLVKSALMGAQCNNIILLELRGSETYCRSGSGC